MSHCIATCIIPSLSRWGTCWSIISQVLVDYGLWTIACGLLLVDYGSAIKAFAAANIFPGDMRLKHLGVTRHGRGMFPDEVRKAIFSQHHKMCSL